MLYIHAFYLSKNVMNKLKFKILKQKGNARVWQVTPCRIALTMLVFVCIQSSNWHIFYISCMYWLLSAYIYNFIILSNKKQLFFFFTFVKKLWTSREEEYCFCFQLLFWRLSLHWPLHLDISKKERDQARINSHRRWEYKRYNFWYKINLIVLWLCHLDQEMIICIWRDRKSILIIRNIP